jgi:hypothetical protein
MPNINENENENTWTETEDDIENNDDSYDEFEDYRAMCNTHRAMFHFSHDYYLEEAARLIARHEGGDEFYRRLDAETVFQWLLCDHSALRETPELQGIHQELLDAVGRYCDELSRANAEVGELMVDSYFFGVPHRDVSLTSWLTRMSPFETTKPLAALSTLPERLLIGRQREKLRLLKHDSQSHPPHSWFLFEEFDGIDFEKMRSTSNGTAFQLDVDGLPPYPAQLVCENVALAVVVHPDVSVEKLIRPGLGVTSRTQWADSKTETRFVIANGLIEFSVSKFENFLLQLRSRLPVFFVFEDRVLLVEYNWNLIGHGRDELLSARARRSPTLGDGSSFGLYRPEDVAIILERVVKLPLKSVDKRGWY